MIEYGRNMTTVVTFSEDGDYITMKIKMYGAGDRSFTLTFKLGEEFEENTMDFRVSRVSTRN